MDLPNSLSLGVEESATLDDYLESVSFEDGSRIFRHGDPGDGCYFIDEGRVRLEVARPELDSEGVIGYLEAGSILGELSMLDRSPRSASAYADGPVAARCMSTERLASLSTERPKIALAVVHALGRDAASKLRAATAQLAELVATDNDPEVDAMVARAHQARREIANWSEDRVDALLATIANAVAAAATSLAEETVTETRIGSVPDKAIKNQMASMGVLQSLVGRTASGALEYDEERQVTEIATAAGVIFAIIPMTNPVATAAFKTIAALKGRNAVIISFHRAALGVGNRTGELIRAALEDQGAPADLVQWIRSRSSRVKTNMFMRHPGVSLILATGGPGMVRAAYSSGTPAIGVGQGNAPALVAADADATAAAGFVVASKSFDHGLICGAEQHLVVDSGVKEDFVSALAASGAAILDGDEVEAFRAQVVDPDTGKLRHQLVGQSAQLIADSTGIERDHPIRVIVVPVAREATETDPFAGEKMAPILSLLDVDGADDGIAMCCRLLEREGTGHTAAIHTGDEALIERFGHEMPASRILVNMPAVHGIVGMTSGLVPSFTLGCGTLGGNSTTDNVSYRNLLNVKRLARFVNPTSFG